MATATMPKRKTLRERRPRVRSPSMREFEDQDEDMLIVSELECEPWQPDMLLERQLSPTLSSFCSSPPFPLTAVHSSTNPFWSPEDEQRSIRIEPDSKTPAAVASLVGTNSRAEILLDPGQEPINSKAVTTAVAPAAGCSTKPVLPVIVKSPSSVITTVTESEYAESTTTNTAVVAAITGTTAAEPVRKSLEDNNLQQTLRPRHQQQLEALQAYLSQAGRQQQERIRGQEQENNTESMPPTTTTLISTIPPPPPPPPVTHSSLSVAQGQQQVQKEEVEAKPSQPEDLQRRNSFAGTPSASLFLDGSDEDEESRRAAENVPPSTVAARRVTAPNILIPARILLPPPPKTMPKKQQLHVTAVTAAAARKARIATISNITTDSYHTARSSLDENGAFSPLSPTVRGFAVASPLATPISITNHNRCEEQTKQHHQQVHQPQQPRQGLDELHDATADSEVILESLQALKDLSMLALDGLLQQVVSYATARDPVFNPDETTLEARALLRQKSLPLLNQATAAAFPRQHPARPLTPVSPMEIHHHPHHPYHESQQQQRQRSPTPPATSDTASSSLERLDNLVRRVDQLAVATGESGLCEESSTISATTMTGNDSVLHEPADIPSTSNASSTASRRRSMMEDTITGYPQLRRGSVDVARVYESPEYQMACTLAALLVCIYRILNRIQHPRPTRTESADTGLDRASKLWKRLSASPLASSSRAAQNQLLMMMTPIGAVRQQHSTGCIVAGDENPSSATVALNRGLLMQSFTRQVKALRSRRTQSTGEIESTSPNSALARRLSGLQDPKMMQLNPHDTQLSQETKALTEDWNELDQLMDQMSHLWQHQEMLNQAIQQEQGRMESPTSPAPTTTLTAATSVSSSGMMVSTSTASAAATTTTTAVEIASPVSPRPMQSHFDRQTLETADEHLPLYDELYGKSGVPGYSELYHSGEKKQETGYCPPSPQLRSSAPSAPPFAVDDEKTRADITNVMSAIERLSRVAPRMDNQRVTAPGTAAATAFMPPGTIASGAPATSTVTNYGGSIHQIRIQDDASDMANTLDRMAKGRLVDQRAHSSKTDFSMVGTPSSSERSHREKHRELHKLIRQIVEASAKSSSDSSYGAQRAEISPQRQWQLEGARISQQIERGERMRIADQDWQQTPEKVLLNDMTRLMDALSQRSNSESPVGFVTQRYVMTEQKARTIALQGILSKIEKMSDRRMGNQDAVLPRPGSSSRTAAINNASLSGITTTTTALPPNAVGGGLASSWSLTSGSQEQSPHPHHGTAKSKGNGYMHGSSSSISSAFRRSSLKAFDNGTSSNIAIANGSGSNQAKYRAQDHREMQNLMDQVLKSGGSQTRKAAMAAQRAEFHH